MTHWSAWAASAVLAMGCAQSHQAECPRIEDYATVTAEYVSGCESPEVEISAIIEPLSTTCVTWQAPSACEAIVEAECTSGLLLWSLRGTLAYDGDGYTGVMTLQTLPSGTDDRCRGAYHVEVRP